MTRCITIKDQLGLSISLVYRSVWSVDELASYASFYSCQSVWSVDQLGVDELTQHGSVNQLTQSTSYVVDESDIDDSPPHRQYTFSWSLLFPNLPPLNSY